MLAGRAPKGEATTRRHGSFDAAAYPVQWPPRAPSSAYFAPPPGPTHVAAYPASPPACVPELPRHKKHKLKVKTGVLFLKRHLVEGAVLPANTKLGHLHTRPSSTIAVSRTDPEPPLFANSNLQNILRFYNISQGSKRARQVAETLLFCEDAGRDQQEPHVCAPTLHAAMKFAATTLETTTGAPRAARTIIHGRNEPLRYVVAPNGITSIGGAVVPCHPLAYPVDVLYCHRPVHVKAMRVELVGQDDRSLGATAIAVCHNDTNGWDPEYFVMLNGTRGEPVCHYMPDKYVLWVAATEI